MKAIKPAKSTSSLTCLRIEKSKLLAELDRLNDCIRETRRTKNPIVPDRVEKVKQIQKRLKEIDITLRGNTTRRGFLKTLKMIRTPPKDTQEENLLAGIQRLPDPIQEAITSKLYADGKIATSRHTGTIRKTSSAENISYSKQNEFRQNDKHQRALNFDIHDWEFSDDETKQNQNKTFAIGNTVMSEEDKLRHELEELKRARRAMKEEHDKLIEMKASLSIPAQGPTPQTTFAPIYTSSTQPTVMSSVPTSYYQTPYIGQQQLMNPYVQSYQAPSMSQFFPYSQQGVPLSNIPLSMSQPNIPISIPNSYGVQNVIPSTQNSHFAIPTQATDNQSNFQYNPFNVQGVACRRTFLKHLDSIPQFGGETREKLMNFIETCDILDRFKINSAENGELLMKITLQLKGEARRAISSDNMDWTVIRGSLLSQYHYLSNRDVLNSKIENLKQEGKETILEYTEKARKLLEEKNRSYDNLNSDQKIEHDRITRKAFIRGIANTRLRDVMRLRGTTSMEEAISLTIELENEIHAIIPNRELFCTFCRYSGHREINCEKKGRLGSPMDQLLNAMQRLNTSNNSENKSDSGRSSSYNSGGAGQSSSSYRGNNNQRNSGSSSSYQGRNNSSVQENTNKGNNNYPNEGHQNRDQGRTENREGYNKNNGPYANNNQKRINNVDGQESEPESESEN